MKQEEIDLLKKWLADENEFMTLITQDMIRFPLLKRAKKWAETNEAYRIAEKEKLLSEKAIIELRLAELEKVELPTK
jgi:hypothetical protein